MIEKIRKKDKVRIISGKSKGKEGEVLGVIKKRGKVLVSGANIAFHHLKPREGHKGGIIQAEKPLPVSKVAVICPNCQKPTRVGFRIEDGKSRRICRRCQGIL